MGGYTSKNSGGSSGGGSGGGTSGGSGSGGRGGTGGGRGGTGGTGGTGEKDDPTDTEIATIKYTQSGVLTDPADNSTCPSKFKGKTSYKAIITYNGSEYEIRDQKIEKYVKATSVSDLGGFGYIRKADFNVKIKFEDCGFTGLGPAGPYDCRLMNIVTGDVKLFSDKKITIPKYETPNTAQVGKVVGSKEITFTDISNSAVSDFSITFDVCGNPIGPNGRKCGSQGLVQIKYDFETTIYLKVKKLKELVDVLYDDDDLRGGTGGGLDGLDGLDGNSFIKIGFYSKKSEDNYLKWIFVLFIFVIIILFLIFRNNKINK